MRVIQKISVAKEKKKINNNLRFLLKKRFSWMKKHIQKLYKILPRLNANNCYNQLIQVIFANISLGFF